MSEDEKEALLGYGLALWMALGVAMIFGFWWGFLTFPVVLIIALRYIL